MRIVIVAAIAACAGSRPTPPSPAAETRVIPAPPPAPASLPLPAGPVDAAVVQAPHGAAISTLAVTTDGGAVVSADDLGSVRLWPTLDGTLEPRVVNLSDPRALAIARDPRGFTIAMLDNIGGLTVQLVDVNGVTLHRVVHAAEPAFVGIEAAPTGFIAWREDQTVVRVGNDGALTQRLATRPGERMVSLAIRGERAFAVIENTTGRPRVRKLVLAPALAWGDLLSAKIVVGSTISVSPNGERIASIVTANNAYRLQAYKLASGEELAEELGRMQLVPVAPSLASGVKLVAISTQSRPTVRWVHDPSDLARGVEVRVDGSVATVSQAGHVLVWESHTGALELVVYRNGKKLGTLPSDGASTIAVDPAGTAVAFLAPNNVQVVGLDGKPRWSLAIQQVHELVWGPSGEVALLAANGLVTVDGTTGVPRAARCGWAFGLSDRPHPAVARVESVCTQIR
jgi:hypothetical protein